MYSDSSHHQQHPEGPIFIQNSFVEEEDSVMDEEEEEVQVPIRMTNGDLSHHLASLGGGGSQLQQQSHLGANLMPEASSSIYQPKCSFVSRAAAAAANASAVFEVNPALDLPGIQEPGGPLVHQEEEDLDSDVKTLIDRYVNAKMQEASQQQSQLSRAVNATPAAPQCSCNCSRNRCLFRQYLSRTSRLNSSSTSSNDQLSQGLHYQHHLSASTSSLVDCNNRRSVSPNLSVSSLTLHPPHVLPAAQQSSSAQASSSAGSSRTASLLARGMVDSHNLATLYSGGAGRRFTMGAPEGAARHYHHHRHRRHHQQQKAAPAPAPPQHSLPDLPANSSAELKETHREFIASAGGLRRVTALYNKLLDLLPCVPDFLMPTTRDGNSLLMILCCQPSNRDNTQLFLHILVVILALHSATDLDDDDEGPAAKAAAAAATASSQLSAADMPAALATTTTHKTDLLFQRNYQEASALELAALSNKSIVVKYLALLYAPHNHDVNETSQAGHSVLHLLARKGDDAADALETLLTLRSDGKRLLRLDVVNGGAKTPLDVANFCQERYQELSFRQVLALFHRTIEDQVLELMSSEDEEDDDIIGNQQGAIGNQMNNF